ncbi:hypothetical protein [Cognatishimia sp.]|uniref:hypothetical protein n=1 Tax=Cognatishimia sp. TaxID=2211648 RepID=UPI003516784D
MGISTVDKEDIETLLSAIKMFKVSPDRFKVIGSLEDANEPDVDETLYIRPADNGRWLVYYVERGRRISMSEHDEGFDAVHDFWRRLTGERGPWFVCAKTNPSN